MSRSTQGHDLNNFVEIHSLMFHAKLQNSGEEDFIFFAAYSHGGHLGHVTCTTYINFCSPLLRMLHVKFGFDWLSKFQRRTREQGHPKSSPFEPLAQVS